MKKIILIVIATCFFACTPRQTTVITSETTVIDHLKTAITGESNASAKYIMISEQAYEQGQTGIAAMFAAASAAEQIHVQNHIVVLNELGENIEVETDPTICESLEANLEGAIEGETYEFTEMYPPMIEQANKEDNRAAVKTFTFAKKAEERHAALYSESLELLKAGKGNEPITWYVCPDCGNLFNTLDGFELCAICGVNKAGFISFEK